MSEPNRNPQPPKLPDSTADAVGRRGFFADALREAMGPLAGLIEKKINPVLAALESLPAEVDVALGALDQPHLMPPWVDSQPSAGAGDEGSWRYLRPPGAREPGDFESTCARCGTCVQVCPAQAIRLDAHGVKAAGVPYIVAAEMPCVVCDSLACMQSCPSGALRPLDKLLIRMGRAKVDHQACKRAGGEDCQVCVEVCPLGAAAIVIGETTGKIRIRDGCIGCGLCEQACPTRPRAVVVEPHQRVEEVIVA